MPTNPKTIAYQEIDIREYRSIHSWLKYHHGKPTFCEFNCANTSKDIDWALKKGYTHQRNKDAYLWLCRKCHTAYDWTEKREKHWRKAIKLSRKPSALLKRSIALKGIPRTQEVKDKIQEGTHKRAVVAFKNGKPWKRFVSLSEAARQLDLKATNIVRMIRHNWGKDFKLYYE